MFTAFHRKTGKVVCAMLARDLAEAMGYRILGIDCAIAWFPHESLRKYGIDNLRVCQNANGPVLTIA